jgi:uncharacterized protein YaaW (UPF0174 family)
MDSVLQVLHQATPEEMSSLATTLDCEPTAEAIVSALQRKSTHFLKHAVGYRPSYEEILRSLSKKHGVSAAGDASQVETRLLQKLWGDVWQRLKPEQRDEFDKKLREESETWGNVALAGTGLTGTALLASSLAGFAPYILASSVVGALTGALGVTLPFAFYMAMSSTLGVILGPHGWIGLGVVALWAFGKPDVPRVTLAVSMIGAIRARQEIAVTTRPWFAWVVASCILVGLIMWYSIHLLIAR